MNTCFDVLVIGGGHAGCEAALAAARLGCSVCLMTLHLVGVGVRIWRGEQLHVGRSEHDAMRPEKVGETME